MSRQGRMLRLGAIRYHGALPAQTASRCTASRDRGGTDRTQCRASGQVPRYDRKKNRSAVGPGARRFLAMARMHRLAALWAVALGIGVRRGEALSLKWSDVDLDRGRLTVRRSLQRVDGKLSLHQTKASTSKRTIPLPQPLIRALREHHRHQHEERFTAGAAWEDHDLVFCAAHGRPIEPRNINRAFSALLRKANLRPDPAA